MSALEKITCLDCGQLNRLPLATLEASAPCGVCGTPLMADQVPEVSLQTLERAARRDTVPLVVDFWAPWCGPCQDMTPQFNTAARALKGKARLVRLNTETSPGADRRFRIRGIPLMVAFCGGRERARHLGVQPSHRITAWIRHL